MIEGTEDFSALDFDDIDCTPILIDSSKFSDLVVDTAEILDEDCETLVRRAFRAVPRHNFLELEDPGYCYVNAPFPIGDNQIQEKPSFLANILGMLGPLKRKRVLELGSGSGYSSALLSEMGAYVYSVEKIPRLAQRARKTLDSLGYPNAIVKSGDALSGWPEHGPFDVIVAWFSVEEVDFNLIEQLVSPGGRFVAQIKNDLVLYELTSSGLKEFPIVDYY